MEEKQFDFEAFEKEAIDKLKTGKGHIGSKGAFTPLIKSLFEDAPRSWRTLFFNPITNNLNEKTSFSYTDDK